MEKRNYTHVQVLLSTIKAMLAEGKSQREVAGYYGFHDKHPIQESPIIWARKEKPAPTRTSVKMIFPANFSHC